MATAKVRGLQTVATRCCCKLPQAAVQVNQKARTNSGATFQNAAGGDTATCQAKTMGAGVET